jgi:hypothetical protein
MKRVLFLLSLLGLVGCADNGANWPQFNDSTAGFEARFPAPPTISSQTIQVTGKDVTVHLVEAQKDGWTYNVSYFEYPPMVSFSPSKAVEGIAAGLKGTVVGTKDSSIAGTDSLLPALQFDIKVGEEPAEGKVFQPEENQKYPGRIFQILILHPKGAKPYNTRNFYHYFKVATR